MNSLRTMISVAALACLAAGTASCSSSSGGSAVSGHPAEGTTAASSTGHRATGTPIKVGYINLQGGSAVSVPEFTEGADAAVTYINSELNGFGGHPVQLVKCYTDSSPASTTTCANEMVDDQVPLVIRGIDANTASDPILAKAGIPYVGGSGTGPADLDTPGVFAFSADTANDVRGMAAYAQQKGWKKVALMAIDIPSVSQILQQVGPAYAKAGVQYQNTLVAPTTPDMTAQVAAAASGNSNAIYFAGSTNLCNAFLKAVGTLGVTVPIFLSTGCVEKSVLSTAPPTALKDAYVMSPIDLGNDGADAQTLTTILRQQDPQADPDSSYVRRGYLPVVALARMLEGFTGQPTASNILQAIRSAPAVPLPFGRGALAKCDGQIVPSLPSLCSASQIFFKVQGIDNFAFVQTFSNLSSFYSS
jgi:branched-chain amino acid transport system substrate-binding protein